MMWVKKKKKNTYSTILLREYIIVILLLALMVWFFFPPKRMKSRIYLELINNETVMYLYTPSLNVGLYTVFSLRKTVESRTVQ